MKYRVCSDSVFLFGIFSLAEMAGFTPFFPQVRICLALVGNFQVISYSEESAFSIILNKIKNLLKKDHPHHSVQHSIQLHPATGSPFCWW